MFCVPSTLLRTYSAEEKLPNFFKHKQRLLRRGGFAATDGGFGSGADRALDGDVD
jgi:hypothetical protein